MSSITLPTVLLPVPCSRLFKTSTTSACFSGFWTNHASRHIRYLNFCLSRRHITLNRCRRNRRCFCHPLRSTTPKPCQRLYSLGCIVPPGLKTSTFSCRLRLSLQYFSAGTCLPLLQTKMFWTASLNSSVGTNEIVLSSLIRKI